MKLKFLLFVIITFLFTFLSCEQPPEKPITIEEEQLAWIPENGFVPDAETAKKLAEAIWLPIYGEDVLNQKPFEAELLNDSIWYVQGVMKEISPGGVALFRIRKKDAKILEVAHSK